MKVYVDFEASEAEHKIISVGCVDENGDTFYSLVYTDDPLTDKIIEITGITQDEVDNAPSSAEAFSALFDWCLRKNEYPEFICYGTSDPEFVNNNLMDATDFKEAGMLSYLYVNMYDCSDEIKEKFYVNKTIALEKLGKYFVKDMPDQNHNALDDAILLKMVYEHIQNETVDIQAFMEYMDPHKVIDQVRKVVRMAGSEIMEEYSSVDSAVTWIKSQPNDKGPKYVQNAADKIKKAAQEEGKYFGFYWRIL